MERFNNGDSVGAPALLHEHDSEPCASRTAENGMDADRLTGSRGGPIGIGLRYAVDRSIHDVDKLRLHGTWRDTEQLRIGVLTPRPGGGAYPIVLPDDRHVVRHGMPVGWAAQVGYGTGRFAVLGQLIAVQEVDEIRVDRGPVPGIIDIQRVQCGRGRSSADGEAHWVEGDPPGLAVGVLQFQGRRIGIPRSEVARVFGNDRHASRGIAVGDAQNSGTEGRIAEDRIGGAQCRRRGGAWLRIGAAVGGIGRRSGGRPGWRGDTRDTQQAGYENRPATGPGSFVTGHGVGASARFGSRWNDSLPVARQMPFRSARTLRR